MDESEFEREAAKLLKGVGVVDTDTLNFFQSKSHGSEWKSSIKVPSPPKARRTSSTGTTHKRHHHRDAQERHQNGSRRGSGEKILKSPQHYSSGSTSTASSGQAARQIGGPDGRFGFVGPASNSAVQPTAVNQVQPVSTTSKRVIARPAPKPPSTTHRKVSPSQNDSRMFQSRPATSIKHTSSAGAPVLINGDHTALHTKINKPANATTHRGSSQIVHPEHNGFHIYDSVDGSKISKPTKQSSPTKQASSPTKQHQKEQLQRRVSAPNRSGDKTQVIHSKPSSFQVVPISNASHRILHTSEDGGSSKRRPSLHTGYFSEAHSHPTGNKPHTSRPLRTLQLSQHSKGALERSSVPQNEPKQESSAHNTSGVYDSLSPPTSPVEQPQSMPLNKPKNDQKLKPSEIQSMSGAYDRLSPVELAAIRKATQDIDTPVNQSRPNPTQDSVSSRQPVSQSRPNPTQDSVSSLQPVSQSRPNPTQDSVSSRQPVSQSRPNPTQDSVSSRQPVSQSRPKPTQDSVSSRQPVSQSRPKPGQDNSKSSQAVSRSLSNPTQDSDSYTHPPVSQSQSSPTLALQQLVSRQTSNTGSNSDHEERLSSVTKQPQPRLTVSSTKSTKPCDKTSYLSTDSSSDSSSRGVKRHMRRHSSEDKHLRKSFASTSAIPQRPMRASETHLERNIYSPSSSSTATLSSPEPLSDRQTPDSDERKSRLDMDWSKQSLDRNMNAVAVSTVQALSTLMEVLTPEASPMKIGNHFKYEDAPKINPNWYAETDDSDTSSYPLSPLSPDLPILSSSEATTSPPVTSPLTTSVSDNTLPTVSLVEKQVIPRVRFADKTEEISSSPVIVSKSVHTENGTQDNTLDHSKSDEKKESTTSPEIQTENENESKQQPRGDSKEDYKQEVGKEDKSSERKSSTEKPQKTPSNKTVSDDVISHTEDSTNTVQENGVDNTSSVIHDYAIIDPINHDYAILDPEFHEEFYGYCQRCTKPVIGADSGCCALDSVYHLKCFTCSKCCTPLSGQNFYTADDQVLCETDYWSMMETCDLCSLRIRDRVLRALDRSYHPDCFRCTTCNECLDGVPYVCDHSHHVYCIPDYHKKYAPRCAICEEPIIPEQGKSKSLRVRTKDKSYHVHCYKCETCGKQLASKSGRGEKCYPHDSHLFCKTCHYKHTSKPRLSVTQIQHNVIGTAL